MIAIESAWLDRVRQARLFCYEMPEPTFSCVDETAGYFHSKTAVTPGKREVIDEIKRAFRMLNSPLGNLRQIAAATLQSGELSSAEARRFLEFFAGGRRGFARARRSAAEEESERDD